MENESYNVPEAIADRDEWIELIGTSPSADTLKAVGLSSYNWKQISAGTNPRIPLACFQLARFARYGRLESILGTDWADFEIRGQRLAFPGLRQPIDAKELRTTWIRLQEIGRLRAENQMLLTDIKNTEARLLSAEQLAQQYRSMILLEARSGLMLCRINE